MIPTQRTCTLLRTITGQALYNNSTSSTKAATGPCNLDAFGICRL